MKYSQNLGPQIHVIFHVQENLVVRIDLQMNEHHGTSWESRGESGLDALIFRWMDQYCSGISPAVTLPLQKSTFSPFTRKVLSHLPFIPFGTVLSYGELAAKIGNPKASRAVGSACGKNPFPLMVPCHRVLAQNYSLGGFSCGLEVKKQLLRHENIAFS